MNISRRGFIAGTLAGAALAGVPAWFRSEAMAAEAESAERTRRKHGANGQINFGAIGLGGSRGGWQMGLNDARSAHSKQGVRVVAVCDVDSVHLDEGAAVFGPECAKYHDFRELLDRRDIDAVVIGTPDHWHAYIAIAAMKAGKDVYCEKPLTLTVDQGKKLVQVAKETGAVFQVGSQQRSDARFRLACELVRNGRIGRIKRVTTHLPTGPTGGPFQVQPAPKDLDWDMWLGPAPWTAYIKERTHGTFRWWLEYSGGMLTDWGAHHNDIAQWGLGMDQSGPVSVEASGQPAAICPTCYNTFPAFNVLYRYAGGVELLCTNEGENGIQFDGEEGWIFVNRETIRASDERLLKDPLPANAQRLYVSGDHMQNFVDCIRTRKPTICTAEVGHRSASVCHLANISLRLGGRRLQWDPRKETIVGDAEAAQFLKRPARGRWQV